MNALKKQKRINSSSPASGKRILEKGILPDSLIDYLYSCFKSRRQLEVAFLVCKRLHANIANECGLPVSYYINLGYCRRIYSQTIERLIEIGLIERRKWHSRGKNNHARFAYNVPFLMNILKNNQSILRGIRKKRIRRTFRVQYPGLKEALKKITLHWSQENAIEYCKSLGSIEDKDKYFNTMRYMSDGFILPSWCEKNGVIYSCTPPLNIKRELWQTNIVGKGKHLFSVDLVACYPNITHVHYTGKPCPFNPYERFIELMEKKGKILTKKRAKKMFNAFLNGLEKKIKTPPKEWDMIKEAILESMGLSGKDFNEVVAMQENNRRLGGEIMNLALIKAVERGITDLLPIVDGFYTTNAPEVIKGIIEEASVKILGCKLPVKIKDMPVFKG